MRQIDVHKLSDEAKSNKFHVLVLFWCALIAACAGALLVLLPAVAQTQSAGVAEAFGKDIDA